MTRATVDETDRLLRVEEVAEITGLTKWALQTWRRSGATAGGPRWVDVGTGSRRVVRYRKSDVQAWIAGLAEEAPVAS